MQLLLIFTLEILGFQKNLESIRHMVLLIFYLSVYFLVKSTPMNLDKKQPMEMCRPTGNTLLAPPSLPPNSPVSPTAHPEISLAQDQGQSRPPCTLIQFLLFLVYLTVPQDKPSSGTKTLKKAQPNIVLNAFSFPIIPVLPHIPLQAKLKTKVWKQSSLTNHRIILLCLLLCF